MTTSTPPNPYVGPRTFERKDAQRFFGRETEARDLLALVGSQRLVLFYAQSGAGKSSLINTRLAPQLEERGLYVLPVGRVGGELPAGVGAVENIYLFNLMLSLDQGRDGRGGDPARLVGLTLGEFLHGLTSDDGQTWYYDPAVEADTSAEAGAEDAYTAANTVLIVDQFEEIITTHADRWPERAGFFQQIDAAMQADPRLRVVLSLREDYVAALDPYAQHMADKLRARFYMERMGVEAALLAVQQPAADAGRPFAPGVAAQLVDDLRKVRVPGQAEPQVGQYVEPVQLQVVCYQLWENLHRAPDDLPGSPETASVVAAAAITFDDLQAAGDVDSALAAFYETAIAQVVNRPALGVSEQQLRTWFSTKLITEAGTRGTVFRDERSGLTAGLPTAAVEVLARQFLLRTELRAGGAWVELVHDRFVAPILASNDAWLVQNLSTLQRAAAIWNDSGRAAGLLLADAALDSAVDWARTHSLLPYEQEFLAASLQLRVAAERERRQSARIRLLAVIAGIVSIMAIAAAVLAWTSSQQVQTEKQRADGQAALALTREAEAVAAKATAESSAAEAVHEKQRAETAAALAVISQETAVANEQLAITREAQAQSAEAAQAEAAATANAEKRNAQAVSTVAIENAATANARFNADSTLVASLVQVVQVQMTLQAPPYPVTPTPTMPGTPSRDVSQIETATPTPSRAIESHAPVIQTVVAQAISRVGSPEDRFVGRQGNQFVLGGIPFRFIGVSIRGLVHYGQETFPFSSSQDQLTNLDAASRMGARVVQVFLPTMHVSAEETGNRLDRLLNLIDEKYPNLYVMPALANRYADTDLRVPGDDQYYSRDPYIFTDVLSPAFYQGGYQDNYLPFVEYTVDRFKDHPRIFAWQLGSELATEDPQLLVSFSQSVAKRIKELDPNHLVTTGLAGTNMSAGMRDNLQSRLALYNSPYIDFVTIHAYNGEYAMDDSDLAHLLNRPFVVEAGFGDPTSERMDRASTVAVDMNRWLGKLVNGYIQWGFMATSFDMGDGDWMSGMDRTFHSDWNSLFCTYRVYAQQLQSRPDIFTESEFLEDHSTALTYLAEGCKLALIGALAQARDVFRVGLAIDPALGINPEVEASLVSALPAVQILVLDARTLAQHGDVTGAAAAFREALALAPDLDIDPEREATHIAVSVLIEQGRSLAQNGNVAGALAKFEEALALDPSLPIEPELLAQTEWGKELLVSGAYTEGLAALATAQTISPTFVITSTLPAAGWSSWYAVCWNGSLAGLAAEVMPACERAVALAPEHGYIHDSRGLARALTGDLEGATEDFEFAVQWAEEAGNRAAFIESRTAWIAALQAGENPFDAATLEQLRNE